MALHIKGTATALATGTTKFKTAALFIYVDIPLQQQLH